MAIATLLLLVGFTVVWRVQCPGYRGLKIPAAQAGKFNIAMVLSRKIAGDKWSRGHFDALLYLQKFLPDANIYFLENIPEFCDSQAVFTGLARQGYDLVLGTAFGYMDSMEMAANDFPEVTFIHVLGIKSNRLNFDNLYGALEDMVYLAGMLAGARANADARPELGFIATLPVPEEFRMINAAALGMAKTCPSCKMDVRWMQTWKDDGLEEKLAMELYEAGAHIVFSGGEGNGLLAAAATRGRLAVPLGSLEQCQETTACLTAPYWNWGPVYAAIARRVQNGEYRPSSLYFHADSGGLGLVGFMPGQRPAPGASDLPAETLDEVAGLLARMQDPNQQAWLEVFSGPIVDNRGRTIVPAGEHLTRTDTDQFPPGGPDEACQSACMYWFASGVTAELPDIGKVRK